MTNEKKQNTPLQDLLAARTLISAGIAKSKKGFGYNYAPLDEIYNVIKQPLEKYNIIYSDKILHTEQGRFLETTLKHVISGEILEGTTLELPSITDPGKMSLMQAEGANITYARRYNIQLILGIIGEEDTDAKPEEGQKQAYNKPKPLPPVKRESPSHSMMKELGEGMPEFAPMDAEPAGDFTQPEAMPENMQDNSHDIIEPDESIGDKTHCIAESKELSSLLAFCNKLHLVGVSKSIIDGLVINEPKKWKLSLKQVNALRNIAKKGGYYEQ